MDAKLDKFSKAIALVKEARKVVNDLLWGGDSRSGVKEVYLLGLLSQTQSLIVSIRGDVIEAWQAVRCRPRGGTGTNGAAPADPEPEPEPDHVFMEKLAFYREALANRRPAPKHSNVIPFNRRRSGTDRRHLHTYLARDRRSGIADRRRRPRESEAASGRA